MGSLAAALLGASVGFLIYNFNPATIFMGDTGSLFLGFMLAAVGLKLRFMGHPDIVTWLTPVLVLGLLGALTFALVYSELIGAICGATLAGILLARGARRNRWALAALGLGVVLPLALTVLPAKLIT